MKRSVFALAALCSLGLAGSVSAQSILVLDWNSNTQGAQNALTGLGYTYTLTTDEVSFNAALPTLSWDLVVVDNPSNGLTDPTPLATYIDSGAGAVILNYWNSDDPVYAPVVTDRMGGVPMVDVFTAQPLFCWDCADGAWTQYTPISEIPVAVDAWNDDGDEFAVTGTGVAVGGFGSGTPSPNRAGLIRANPVNLTYLVGAAADNMDPVAQLASWQNLIQTGLGASPPLCLPVSSLSATDPDCGTDTIELSWVVTDPSTTAIEVSRDGNLIATLGGSDTSYTDTGVVDGPHTYSVVAVCGSDPASSASTTVTSTGSGAVAHVVVRREGAGGLVDSATALGDALTSLGQSWVEVPDLTTPVCLDASTTLWVMTGTYPNNSPLDGATGDALVAHVLAGGSVYFEGGDTWGFDAPTAFAGVDGVDDATAFDGNDSFVSMTGVAGNVDTSDFVAVAYTQDTAGNDYTDQIGAATADTLGPNSTVIWSEAGGAYNTGVAYETTDPSGNVISQSWELGGFGGDLVDLTGRYVAFLGGTVGPSDPSFVRGNLNGDGAVDISDAIFGLSALFVPGSASPGCLDAADVNSDGGFDISDMIYLLSSLFVPGSPSPAAPFPTCAPSPEVLGCTTPQC